MDQMNKINPVPEHRRTALLQVMNLFCMCHVLGLLPYFLGEFRTPRNGLNYTITDLRKYAERHIPHNIEEWKTGLTSKR